VLSLGEGGRYNGKLFGREKSPPAPADGGRAKGQSDKELDDVCDRLMTQARMGLIAGNRKLGDELDPVGWAAAAYAIIMDKLRKYYKRSLNEAEPVVRCSKARWSC
jgi:hypothetical protein